MSENAPDFAGIPRDDKVVSDTVILRGGPLDNRRRTKVGKAPVYQEDGHIYRRTADVEGGEAVFEYDARP